MTAAFRAVLPVAHARFHEVADQAGARDNLDVFRASTFTGAADQDRHALQW